MALLKQYAFNACRLRHFLQAGRHKLYALSLNNSCKSTEAGMHFVYLGRKIEDNGGTEVGLPTVPEWPGWYRN